MFFDKKELNNFFDKISIKKTPFPLDCDEYHLLLMKYSLQLSNNEIRHLMNFYNKLYSDRDYYEFEELNLEFLLDNLIRYMFSIYSEYSRSDLRSTVSKEFSDLHQEYIDSFIQTSQEGLCDIRWWFLEQNNNGYDFDLLYVNTPTHKNRRSICNGFTKESFNEFYNQLNDEISKFLWLKSWKILMKECGIE